MLEVSIRPIDCTYLESRITVKKSSKAAITSSSSAPRQFTLVLLLEETPLEVTPYLDSRPTATTSFSKLQHYFGSMSSTTLFRFAARTQPSCLFRSSQPARRFSPPRGLCAGSSATATCSFSTTMRRAADKDGEGAAPGHHEESFEEFTARYADTPTGPQYQCAPRHLAWGIYNQSIG